MLRKKLVSLSLLAGTVALGPAVMVQAQDGPRAGALQPRAERDVDVNIQSQRLSTILDSRVLIQNDQPAGKAVDVILSESGCVEYIVATYEDRYYVVPYAATQVRYTDNVVFVDVTPAQFRQVPFFAANSWPQFTPAYRQTVFQTFNVNIDADGNRGPRRALRPNYDNRNDRDRNDRDRNNRDNVDRDNSDRNDPAMRNRNRGDDNNRGDNPDRNTSPANRDDNNADRPNPAPRPRTDNPDNNTVKPDSTPTPRPRLPGTEAPKPGAEAPKTEQPRNPSPSNPEAPGTVDPPVPGNRPEAAPKAPSTPPAPQPSLPGTNPKPSPSTP